MEGLVGIMRVLLFRGKSKKQNNWAFGKLIIPNNKLFGCEVYEDSVGQFTGVYTDKGTTIFEGDVIGDGREFGVVEWDKNSGSFVINWRSGKVSNLANGIWSTVGAQYDLPDIL